MTVVFEPLAQAQVWGFREGVANAAESLRGYAIQAGDCAVGHVIAAADEPGFSYVIAACGRWNDGRMAMLPAGLVERVVGGAAVILLDCSRGELAAAPAFESDRYRDAAYRSELGAYYASIVPSGFDRVGVG